MVRKVWGSAVIFLWFSFSHAQVQGIWNISDTAATVSQLDLCSASHQQRLWSPSWAGLYDSFHSNGKDNYVMAEKIPSRWFCGLLLTVLWSLTLHQYFWGWHHLQLRWLVWSTDYGPAVHENCCELSYQIVSFATKQAINRSILSPSSLELFIIP